MLSCFRTEVEYDIAKTTPIFKKSAPQRLDPDEYPHVHDQLRNHMVTSKFKIKSIIFLIINVIKRDSFLK